MILKQLATGTYSVIACVQLMHANVTTDSVCHTDKQYRFLPPRCSKRGICYGNVAGWVAGCLSVTRRYCIKTTKPILKLFHPSGRAIILVSSDPCADIQFPSAGALNTRGGKIGDFRRKSPFISETVRDRPMVTMER